MSALIITVTDAGRAAIVNAQHNGTAPVLISSMGVTGTAFVPDKTQTVLAAEIKRINTISGGPSAADTLHVTVRDDGTDTYSVRGIGFYLADGTLFAVYGQADVLIEKSAQATLLLAGDIQFADILAADLTLGDTNFLINQATTTVLGIVQLATDAQAIAGSDLQLAIVPHALKAALDDRLGAGAPTSFVKTLLNKISALAFVTALGIRGAASYDTGAGNGLDADLLDGQHGAYYLSYANLTGVPATFAPSPHQHSAADITSGTLVVARGGTGAGTFTAGSYLLGNGTNALASKTPAQVLTDIAAAPLVHSHEIAAVNGLQAALDAKTTPAAVTAQITAAVNALINGSPGALDTLKELADAMGDDPNFAATVTNALAQKANLSGAAFTGGISFGATVASSPSDVTRHLALWGNTFGLGVTSSTLNFVSGGGFAWQMAGNQRASLDASGNFVISGTVSASQGFISTTANFVGSPTGAGTCYLRPNGQNNTAGQFFVNSAGNCGVAGSITATGGFQVSDARLKKDIEDAEPRPLHRSIPHKRWRMIADDAAGIGAVAQDVQAFDPLYVNEFELPKEHPDDESAPVMRLGVDKAGVALEQAMWAGNEVDRLKEIISNLTARVAALENRA